MEPSKLCITGPLNWETTENMWIPIPHMMGQ